MTKKQEIKQSEARVLVYLSIVHPTRRYVTAIANKLQVDYSYLMRILQSMAAKGWLTKHQYRRMMFYSITDLAPLEGAKTVLMGEALQESLKGEYTQEEIRVVPTSQSAGGEKSNSPNNDEDTPADLDTPKE